MLAVVLQKARIWDFANRRRVNARQRAVINRLLEGFEGLLTTSKYAKIAKCSADTALRDIRELLELGVLVQNPGGGRSTSYRLAEPDELVP
jgi:Fic family protein